MDKIINFLNENGIEMEIFNGNEFAQDVPEEVKETYETMIKSEGSSAENQFFITIDIPNENKKLAIIIEKSKEKTKYMYYPNVLFRRNYELSEKQIIQELRNNLL